MTHHRTPRQPLPDHIVDALFEAYGDPLPGCFRPWIEGVAPSEAVATRPSRGRPRKHIQRS